MPGGQIPGMVKQKSRIAPEKSARMIYPVRTRQIARRFAAYHRSVPVDHRYCQFHSVAGHDRCLSRHFDLRDCRIDFGKAGFARFSVVGARSHG